MGVGEVAAVCCGLGGAWSVGLPGEGGEWVKGLPGIACMLHEAKLIPGGTSSTLKSLVAYSTL